MWKRSLRNIKLGCIILSLIATFVLVSYVFLNEGEQEIEQNQFISDKIRVLSANKRNQKDEKFMQDTQTWLENKNNDYQYNYNWSRQHLLRSKNDGTHNHDREFDDETSWREDTVRSNQEDGANEVSDKNYPIPDYCNSPFHETTGQEGFAPSGYKLETVAIFLRHGIRTSLYSFRSGRNLEINCEFNQSVVRNHVKFSRFTEIQSQYTGKQHPLSAFQNFPFYPNQKICVKSQLTGHGSLQHLKLGEHLSKVYLKKWQLLSPTSEDFVQVKCTPYSRTYQSVVAFLYAFLPQFNLTNLNILEGKTVFFYPESFPSRCSILHKLQKDSNQYVASHLSNNKTERNALITEIAKILNQERSELPLNWAAIWDILLGYLCHTSFLHTNKNKNSHKSIIHRVWMKLEKEKHFQFMYDKSFVKMNKLAAYPVLTEMTQVFLNFIKQRKIKKFIIYSGHDKTLTALMITLGLIDVDSPKYASRIVLEMYSYDDKFGKRTYVIRCLYDGQDVTDRMTFCEFDRHGLCTIESFIQFIFSDLLKTVGVENYHNICN